MSTVTAPATATETSSAAPMSFSESLDQIRASKERTLELETRLETQRLERLRQLHTELGYEDVDSLMKALKAAHGKGRKGKSGSGGRSTITDEMKAKVVTLVKAGKLTANEIAEEVGISVASVQNIKKDAGLVASRK